MLQVIGRRVCSAIRNAARRAACVLRSVTRPVPLVAGLLGDLVRSRTELLAENALLRQQLIVAARCVTRPAFRPHERGLLVLLARLVRAWPQAILLVRPETVLRWHREGFRLFWKWRSRRRRQPAEPRVSPSTIALIRRMADDNRLRGSERIRGEVLKLGIRVAKGTVQRYMRGARPSAPHGGQRWSTFLRNHTVWACDFLQTYDVWFRPIFALFIVDVNTRRVVRVAVTRAPTQQWAAQQLRNATPFGQGPQVLIRDRDDKFGADFDRVAKGAGTRVLRTAVQAPLMNSVCERFLGSVRRECLDHLLILSEPQLKQVLDEYALSYFNTSRPHQGIGQRLPLPGDRGQAQVAGTVTAIPVLSGLHHDYRAAA
jgi:putative transposase